MSVVCTSSTSSYAIDFAPSTAFPSCWIGSYDIFLIGSNNGSSLAVKSAGGRPAFGRGGGGYGTPASSSVD
ncbi:hypothetical protein IEQ34_019892 [Dendrobium chrysotoxum]|uniref:Uncharacterized protein n=1 Tax=Dendrobium chrysotoxum TaxID=161865 RepID=A0AAV7GA77_DENCH|nr:hypothetical protein IEQ34_019892 [Dendrobium chrysotoxum]